MAARTRTNLARVAAVVVSALVLATLLSGCGPDSPLVAAQKAAATDIAFLQHHDYGGSYKALSKGDQAKVTEADWIRRCQEVTAATGGIRDYRTSEGRWLDAGKTIVVVDVEVDFTNATTPRKTQMFYVTQDGKPVQSMLWGQTIDLAKGAQ